MEAKGFFRIYQSCVLSTLLCGSECWRTTEHDMSAVLLPHNKSQEDFPNVLAKGNLQQRNAGGDKPGGHAHDHHQKALEVAWPRAPEGQRLDHNGCSALDLEGEEKERPTKDNTAQNCGVKAEGHGPQLGHSKKNNWPKTERCEEPSSLP